MSLYTVVATQFGREIDYYVNLSKVFVVGPMPGMLDGSTLPCFISYPMELVISFYVAADSQLENKIELAWSMKPFTKPETPRYVRNAFQKIRDEHSDFDKTEWKEKFKKNDEDWEAYDKEHERRVKEYEQEYAELYRKVQRARTELTVALGKHLAPQPV